jgi:hypothetical protein
LAAELIADCASDPPLGATRRALAVHRARDVLYGLGAVALFHPQARLRAVARHPDAAAALVAAAEAAGAQVLVTKLGDAWPPLGSVGEGRFLPAEHLVRIAEEARGVGARRYVTVAGAVAQPAVTGADVVCTVEELVAAAGGADAPDWVAVAGGVPAGRRVERQATLDEVDDPLLLILSHAHPAARRLAVPVSHWLLRAASACEACRACSDGCPHVAPHELIATLLSGRADDPSLARALGCAGCGLCDALCPAALSPLSVTRETGRRLTAAGAPPMPRLPPGGLDVGLFTLRLGLGGYDRAPDVRL